MELLQTVKGLFKERDKGLETYNEGKPSETFYTHAPDQVNQMIEGEFSFQEVGNQEKISSCMRARFPDYKISTKLNPSEDGLRVGFSLLAHVD